MLSVLPSKLVAAGASLVVNEPTRHNWLKLCDAQILSAPLRSTRGCLKTIGVLLPVLCVSNLSALVCTLTGPINLGRGL